MSNCLSFSLCVWCLSVAPLALDEVSQVSSRTQARGTDRNNKIILIVTYITIFMLGMLACRFKIFKYMDICELFQTFDLSLLLLLQSSLC